MRGRLKMKAELIKKFERITLDAIKFHTIDSVVDYINADGSWDENIAANYALDACIENGRGVTLDEGRAHLEILADAGAVFDKDEALALFGQAVALAVE